jgi:hypothetical protein
VRRRIAATTLATALLLGGGLFALNASASDDDRDATLPPVDNVQPGPDCTPAPGTTEAVCGTQTPYPVIDSGN